MLFRSQYDWTIKSWINSVSVPPQAPDEGVFDFRVLPNGQKAYLANLNSLGSGIGWLYAVDLLTKQVKAVPIDGYPMCLEANPSSTRIYIGTGWPSNISSNNLLVLDTTTDTVLGSIPLGLSIYGWPYSQINDLQIDPNNSRFLYATSTDGNALIKLDIEDLTLSNVKVFNREKYQPHTFIRREPYAFGNIIIHKSAKSFEFNLNNATIDRVVRFPGIRQDVYVYDVGILSNGRFLIIQGEYFLEVDPQEMAIVETHPLPNDIPSLWAFSLSNDKTKIYSLSNYLYETATYFFVLNSVTF